MPSGLRERGGVPLVTLGVAFELRKPVSGIRPRRHAVDGAAMPEAAEALHGYALPREDHIGPVSQTGDQRDVLAKAQAPAVQLAT